MSTPPSISNGELVYDEGPTTPIPNGIPPESTYSTTLTLAPPSDLALRAPTEQAAADDAHLAPTPQPALSHFRIDDSPTSANRAVLPSILGDVTLPDIAKANVDADSLLLAKKTNKIMSEYKIYINEIQSELREGNVDDAMRDLEAAKGDAIDTYGINGTTSTYDNGGTGGSGPHAPFRYSASSVSSISDTNPNTSNLHDVNLPTRRESHAKMDDASSFEDFYGELSFHPRRNYRHAVLRNANFQRFCMGLVGCVVVFGVIAGVATRGGDGAEQTEQEQLDAIIATMVPEDAAVDHANSGLDVDSVDHLNGDPPPDQCDAMLWGTHGDEKRIRGESY